jgi:hypothetical protein
MMNKKQICAGNIRDMCRPAMLPMINRGNEAIGSKVIRNTNFCRKGLLFFLENPYKLLAVYDLYSCRLYCTIARMSSFSCQCQRLSRRLVLLLKRTCISWEIQDDVDSWVYNSWAFISVHQGNDTVLVSYLFCSWVVWEVITYHECARSLL